MAQLSNLNETDQVNIIDVKVMKYISDDYYIVGDISGFMILVSDQRVNEGQAYKLIKPKLTDQKIKKKPKFAMIKVENVKTKILTNEQTENLTSWIKPTVEKDDDETMNDLEKIDSLGLNGISAEIVLLVCNVSRLIEGRFGNYRIIKVKDIKNNQNDMNLYKQWKDIPEKGEVYKFSNLKVTSYKSKDEKFV